MVRPRSGGSDALQARTDAADVCPVCQKRVGPADAVGIVDEKLAHALCWLRWRDAARRAPSRTKTDDNPAKARSVTFGILAGALPNVDMARPEDATANIRLLLAKGWLCGDCLMRGARVTRATVYEILTRLASRAGGFRTEVRACGACGMVAAAHTIR